MQKAPDDTKVQGLSADTQLEKLEALKLLLPEAFSEGRFDAEKIGKIFDTEVLAGNEEGERFRLEWAGKGKVFDEIARRTSCTLALDEKRSSGDFENSQNVFIEGENLEVLRMLQKAYHGKVKMIYIDPPYNTGKDFVYNDNFRQTEAEYNEDFCNLDEKGNVRRAFSLNSKDSGRFHSNWLSMMYPRLYLARNLLQHDGVIFVSISDHEVHNLRFLMNEIFGEENFISMFSWMRTATPPSLSPKVRKKMEWILLYQKSDALKELSGEMVSGGDMPLLNEGNAVRTIVFPGGSVLCNLPDGTYAAGERDRVTLHTPAVVKDHKILHDLALEGPFKWTQETVLKEVEQGTTFIVKTDRFAIRYIREGERGKTPSNLITKSEVDVDTNERGAEEAEELLGKGLFDHPKPTSLIKYLIRIGAPGKNDLVLDFFAGSGTTAHAVMGQNAEDDNNRPYICVQMPEETPEGSLAKQAGYEKISDIAIKRIEKASEKIHKEHPDFSGDLGFRVYRETDSNFPQWHSRSFGSDEDLTSSLLEHASRIPDGDEQARVTEVLLKLGYPLTAKIEQKDGFCVADGTLALALDESFKTENLLKIFEVEPSTVVVLERIFKDDSQKINFALRCKEAKIIFQTI